MPSRGERGRTIRAAHLGYDLYVTGPINQSVGRVRIVQRPTRMPPNVSDELKTMLPMEMWWPQRDIKQAMACVDACLTMDIAQLLRWKEQFPENVFGYERYIDWLRRLKAAQGTNTPDARGRGGPGKLTPIQLSHFPAKVDEILPYKVMQENGYLVKIAVVKFIDHTSALRFTVYGKLVPGAELDEAEDHWHRTKKQLVKMSRAYVDPVDGEFDIIEHFPGRYQALELPENILHTTLGIKHFKMHRRESIMKRRAEIPTDLEGEGDGAEGASRRGSAAHGARISNGNGVMSDSIRVQTSTIGGVRAPRPRGRAKTYVTGSGGRPTDGDDGTGGMGPGLGTSTEVEPGVVP